MATQNYFKAKNGLEAPSQSTIAITDSEYATQRANMYIDFANSKSFDSRLQFSRASSASYYSADGSIKYVSQDTPRIEYDPITLACKGLLVEEQRTNLALSNTIDGPYFVKEQCSIGAYTVAPDGSASAFKMTEDTSTAYHRVRLGTISVTSGSTYTISMYAKYAGRQYLIFNCDALINARAAFDLINGTATNISSTSVAITPVGNGWYRCSLTNTASLTQTTSGYFGGSTTATDTSYAGDGVSGIYMWGFQIEAGSFPTSYIPTTTTFTSRASSATYFDSTGTLRIAGINQARYGYGYDSTLGKWVSQGLVLEAAASNILPYTLQYFTTGQGLNITANAATAPDGTTTAILASENNTNTQGFSFYYPAAGTAQVQRCFSVYAKAGPGSRNIRLYWDGLASGNTGYILYDLTNGTATAQFPSNVYLNSYGIVPVGNGWYRCWFSGTPSSSETTTYVHIDTTSGTNTTYTGVIGNGVYLWGAQLEYSAVPTSYIYNPIYGSSATRAADVSSSTATTRAYDVCVLPSKYSPQRDYTVKMSYNCIGYGNPYPRFWQNSYSLAAIWNDGNPNYVYLQHSHSSANNATVYATNTTVSPNVWNNVAFSYNYTTKTNTANANGLAPLSITTPGYMGPTDWYLFNSYTTGRSLNAYVSQVMIYNSALTSSQLQAITK